MNRIMLTLLPALLLAADTVQDLRRREICAALTVFGGAAGAIWRFAGAGCGIPEFAVCLLPGVFFLVLGFLGGGIAGPGDGLLLLALGSWCSAAEMLLLCPAALAAAAAAGGILCAAGHRKKELPFVPFLAGAWALVRFL